MKSASTSDLQSQFNSQLADDIIRWDKNDKKIDNIKRLTNIIKQAESQDVALDFSQRVKDYSILTLVSAASERDLLESLLSKPEFHPARFKYHRYDFCFVRNYETVQVFFSHPELIESMKKTYLHGEDIFNSLMRNDLWLFAKINHFNEEKAEPECKELIGSSIKEYKNNDDGIILRLYNAGVKVINNNKNLLENYNKLSQTYYAHKSGYYTGQLKTLYLMRIGMDKMSGDDIWKMFKEYKFNDSRERAIGLPSGATLPTQYAAMPILALYIINNKDKFSFLTKDDLYEVNERANSTKSNLRFTGYIPGFGSISKDNLLEVINSLMTNSRNQKIFNLLEENAEAMKESKSVSAASDSSTDEKKPLASSPAYKKSNLTFTQFFPEKKEQAVGISQFPQEELYRLFIDENLVNSESGWQTYEKREPGCIAALCKAAEIAWFHQMEDKEINLDLIKSLHRSVTTEVKELNRTDITPGELRKNFNYLPMMGRKFRATPEGISDLFKIILRQKKAGYDSKEHIEKTIEDFKYMYIHAPSDDEKQENSPAEAARLAPIYTGSILSVLSLKSRKPDSLYTRYTIKDIEERLNLQKDMNPEEKIREISKLVDTHVFELIFCPPAPHVVLSEMEMIIENYNVRIKNAKSADEKLEIIAETIKEFELLHPFPDANTRVFAILLCNRLLMQQGFGLAIFSDPNNFGLLGKTELVSEIKKALENASKIAKQVNTGETPFKTTKIPEEERTKFNDWSRNLYALAQKDSRPDHKLS